MGTQEQRGTWQNCRTTRKDKESKINDRSETPQFDERRGTSEQ
jgi:hypothetical protein